MGINLFIFIAVLYLLTLLVKLDSIGITFQTQWERFLGFAGSDPFTHYVYGTYLLSNLVYFGVGFLYTALDLTGFPRFLRKYKVQPNTNDPLIKEDFSKLMSQVLYNHTVVMVPFLILAHFVQVNTFEYPALKQLPSASTIVWQFAVFLIFEEIGFFYSHWMLHHKAIYKHIHKRHHEWISPVALAATYAHPIEMILANLIPPAIGPLILKSHPVTAWIWYCLALIFVLNEHSGYHFPLLPSPEAHDFHHLKFNQNYGPLGILDYLHGTDLMFRSNMAYKRHRTIYSTKSARELYPDEKQK